MAEATVYEDIPLPAEEVWEVVGDFANIRRWAVAVKDQEMEEGSSGRVRLLTMPDGTVVKEALIVMSQHSYTYTLLDVPDSEDYRSTIAVLPLDRSRCRIELIIHNGSAGGQDESEVEARYTRFLRGNLKAMKRALGLA